MNNEVVIRIENLSKKYLLPYPIASNDEKYSRELWALKDVSLEINKGESVGIIGPNGSGKSTLLKILAGITAPTTGSIEINGKVASILDIGAGFHPELSGRENVLLNGHLLGFRKKEIMSKFDEIVSFSGIEKFIDEPVKTYSNGMYLRLAFSIVAHLETDILILDEVIAAGDAEFQLKSKNAIRKMITEKKTLIMVSHNYHEITNNCTHLCLIEGGKISFYGQAGMSDARVNYFLSGHSFLLGPEHFFIDTQQFKNKLFDAITIVEAFVVNYTSKTDGIAGELPVTLGFTISLDNTADSFNIGMHCRYLTDLSVFTTLNTDVMLNQRGTYRTTFQIPGNLLNTGIYMFDFIAVNKKSEVQRLNKIIVLKISARSNSFNRKMPGIIHPNILSHIEYY